MSKIIMITSLKGGVGKTTVAANLAMAIARSGRTVCAVDCDLESRCLDMILGLENDALYNLADVLSGRCETEDALVHDERCDNLAFIAAPTGVVRGSEEYSRVFTRDNVSKFVSSVSEYYDYIIFDLPAHPDKWYELLLKHADFALVVAMHTAVSVRSAEKTASVIVEAYDALSKAEALEAREKTRREREELQALAKGIVGKAGNEESARVSDEKDLAETDNSEAVFDNIEDEDDEVEFVSYAERVFSGNETLKIRLVINSFKHKDINAGIRSGIYDIINKTSIQLIGVVPYDEKMAAAQESGVLAYQLRGDVPSATAFKNISSRIQGANIPLLEGILKKKARKKTF